MSPDKSLSMLIDSITETTSSSEPIHDWLLINDFNEEDLKDFLLSYTHKMTSTHGSQLSKCNLHPRSTHKQEYGYMRCSSLKCFKTEEDSCLFVFKVIY